MHYKLKCSLGFPKKIGSNMSDWNDYENISENKVPVNIHSRMENEKSNFLNRILDFGTIVKVKQYQKLIYFLGELEVNRSDLILVRIVHICRGVVCFRKTLGWCMLLFRQGLVSHLQRMMMSGFCQGCIFPSN